MLVPAACFPQKSLSAPARRCTARLYNLELLKISPWRGKGTLVRLRKLCSQINEQLKQNQITMPIEIAPLPSDKLQVLTQETQTPLPLQWRDLGGILQESKPLEAHLPSLPPSLLPSLLPSLRLHVLNVMF